MVRVDCEPSTNPRHPLHLRVSMIDQIRVGGDPGRQLSPAEFSLEQRAAWVLASDGAGAVATADLVEASAAPPVDGKQWFVAFTSPKREPSVAKAARQRAFASYVPTQLVSRTVSRRRVTVGSPLLPRLPLSPRYSARTFFLAPIRGCDLSESRAYGPQDTD